MSLCMVTWYTKEKFKMWLLWLKRYNRSLSAFSEMSGLNLAKRSSTGCDPVTSSTWLVVYTLFRVNNDVAVTDSGLVVLFKAGCSCPFKQHDLTCYTNSLRLLNNRATSVNRNICVAVVRANTRTVLTCSYVNCPKLICNETWYPVQAKMPLSEEPHSWIDADLLMFSSIEVLLTFLLRKQKTAAFPSFHSMGFLVLML